MPCALNQASSMHKRSKVSFQHPSRQPFRLAPVLLTAPPAPLPSSILGSAPGVGGYREEFVSFGPGKNRRALRPPAVGTAWNSHRRLWLLCLFLLERFPLRPHQVMRRRGERKERLFHGLVVFGESLMRRREHFD